MKRVVQRNSERYKLHRQSQQRLEAMGRTRLDRANQAEREKLTSQQFSQKLSQNLSQKFSQMFSQMLETTMVLKSGLRRR